MAPTRKRGSKVSTAIARKEWDVGDLVMAKVKGFPAWPAQVSRAQEFNQTPNPSRVFVYFFGTQQIRFCLHTEISDFTPEVRAALTTKCQSKGTIADLRLAVKEICEADDEIRAAQCKQNHNISNEEGESLHSLRSSSENKELQKHLEVEDKVGLEESNIKEEIFAPINDLVKDGPGTGYVADGGNITKVVDGGKSSKKGKEGKSGNIYRVSKQEAEGIRHNLTSHSVEKNNDQDASGGRTRAELGKCEKRVAELGTKSFQNAQTQSLEGNKETVNMQKGDFEPVVKTGSQNSHRFDNGILHTNSLGLQKKKAKNRYKEPAKDQVESSIENLAKCSGKGEKRSPIKLDVAHDEQQEVMKSTESSTGLIRVGNVSTNFAAHEGLEVDDFEYADSDYKRAQEGLTSRAHQFLQQQQDAGKSLDFFVSRPVKHKGNDQKPKLSGETSGVHGKVKHTDKQDTVHASPISRHDEGTKLERRKIDDSGNIESHISNKNEQGLYSKATHDVGFEKDRAFVKRRKLVDSQVTVKIQLATAYKETKLAGDASGTPVSQKLKKVVRDSDEHLPLVKRARARGHGEYIKSISDDQSPVLSQERQSMQDQEHFEFAERVKLKRNAPLNADAVSAEQQLQQFEGRNLKFEETGQGSLPLKADKHRIRSTLFDGEAALPPSKRRQRALEAMTACVAEAASIETDKVKQRDEHAENHRSSSPVKQPASTGDIAIKGIITRNVNEAVCDVSPLSRKSDAGVHQNKDDVAVEMLGRESVPKVETFFGLHHFDVATETKPVTGQGNVVSHTLFKIQESGDASKLRSPILEGKTKGKNQNLISTNELSNNTSARQNSGLESMPTLKVPESSIREHAATSAPRSVIANTQPKTFVSQARPFSSMSQDIGRNDGGSPNIQLEEKDKNVREAYEVAKEIKQRMFLKEKDSSLLSTSMKYLIAAAQAKRPIRSQGAADLVPLESERLPIFLASSPSSRYERGDVRPDSPIQQYPVHLQAEALPANEAGACSERYKVNVSGDKREDFQTGNRHAECGEDASQNLLSYEEQEAAIARDALEGMLETLSRTKDSIGRVTRHAIDCAKFGIAEQVVEVIVRKLEDEHSFRRRVDLFFLLDSITQCSVKDKGVAEATYPPAVQAALPRLLKAAAPPGNNARENRRQCLKVLNLWLERNILPAQVIRQFMNGIEAHDADKGLVSMGPRPSRNERAIDDPLREMEGIVDEYGSNAGYALPGFFVPRIFDDDDDEGNECVQKADESAFEDMCRHELGDNKDEKTEQSMKGFLNNDSKSSFEVGRHRHFLEDVDGELEMEDVSPIADDFRARGEQMEDNSPWSTSVEVAVSSTEMISQPPLPSAVPPSPICPPPSPPPLPMSPPPSPPPPPASPPPTMVAQPPIADTGFTNISFKVASVPTQQSFNTLPSSGGPNLFSSFEQVRSAESVPSRFETAFDHYSQKNLVPGLMQPSIQSIKPNIVVERTFNSPPNFVVTQIPPPHKFSMHLSSSYIPISEPQKPLPSVTPLIQTMQLENVNTLQQCYVFPPLPSPQSQGKTSGLIGEVPYGLQQPWSAMLPPSGLEKEHVMMPRVQDQQWEVLHRDHGWEKVQDQICFSEYASQGVVLNAAPSKSKLMEGEKSGGGFHPVAYQPTGINTYPPELVNGFTGPRQGQGFQSIPPGLPLPTVAGSVPWVPYSGSSNMESLFSQSTGLPGLPAEKSAPTPQAQLQLPGFRASIPSSNLWRPL